MRTSSFGEVKSQSFATLSSTLGVVSVLACPIGASAQILLNGSFESSLALAEAEWAIGLAPGSDAIEHWVINGSVDLVGSLWQAGEGTKSVDLSAASAGSMSQTITGLELGHVYRINFLLSGNSDGRPGWADGNTDPFKSMVLTLGSLSREFTFDTTGRSVTDMGWSPQSFDFVADATSMTMSLSSLENNAFGPAVDDFSIVIIPEPSVASLLMAAAFALGFRNRHVFMPQR